jgi:putative transposase
MHHLASRKTYGVRRIRADLQAEQRYCGKGRIAKLMKQLGIKAAATRQHKVTTDSNHRLPIAPNLLSRNFYPPEANQAWASDISYIPTQTGFLYLATVIDLYSRMIIDWSLSRSLKTPLIIDALTIARTRRQSPIGLVIHSDRGSKSASALYQKTLKNYGMICSMSNTGCCYDNAVMESFYHTLKVELIYTMKLMTEQQASNAIFDYIESFYNRQRRHSTLNYLSPMAYEAAA